MSKRFVYTVLLVFVSGAAWLTIESLPRTFDINLVPDHRVNLVNGETLFWAGGCASCHAAAGSKGDKRLHLVGGVELNTPFGVFRAPNISPDAESGIGRWSTADFFNAMVNGVSPQGYHYYPAFPYVNYRIMPYTDLIDLKAYLDTLPAKSSTIADHDLSFPFNIRAGLGLWKLLYLNDDTFSPEPGVDPQLERGRYLVNGPAHCGACHTPRDAFGGEIKDRFLAGAVSPEGNNKDGDSRGQIPNITPHADGLGDWSRKDIAYALETGFDPDFDSFGGSMVEVQENMAKLPSEDRMSIAAYLKTVKALPSEKSN
jgi:mono/diheme cytochrome c family protein